MLRSVHVKMLLSNTAAVSVKKFISKKSSNNRAPTQYNPALNKVHAAELNYFALGQVDTYSEL